VNIWHCDFNAIYMSFEFKHLFTCEVVLEERYHASASGAACVRGLDGVTKPFGEVFFHSLLKAHQEVAL
jgi:hypothetical protein